MINRIGLKRRWRYSCNSRTIIYGMVRKIWNSHRAWRRFWMENSRRLWNWRRSKSRTWKVCEYECRWNWENCVDWLVNNLIKMRMIRGIKMDKILMWIAIILIGLSGFSIKINSFEFEWLGLLETIIRIFK